MAAITICSDFGAQENKVCHCFHCFHIYLLWRDGARCHHLKFFECCFKSAFSLSWFTFVKRLFSSSSLSAISVVSSAYLRLLIFLLAVLIPVSASSSLAITLRATELNWTESFGGLILHLLGEVCFNFTTAFQVNTFVLGGGLYSYVWSSWNFDENLFYLGRTCFPCSGHVLKPQLSSLVLPAVSSWALFSLALHMCGPGVSP